MKVIVVFLAGALAGILVGLLLIGRPLQRRYENQYVLGVLDQAYVALQISQGRSDLLQRSIEEALPAYVTNLTQAFPPSPLRAEALWMIRAYYERNALIFPDDIKAVIEGLPAVPPEGCRQKLEELDRASAARPEMVRMPDPAAEPAP
jgi:hypothetical protein